MLTDEQLNNASKFSIRNKKQIDSSEIVGCYCCLKIYPKSEIEDWTEGNISTAICKYCGVDSLLGDASPYPINERSLKQLNKRWFS